jgi:uncharacterized protein YfdQ (DUF2303 family)
MRAELLTSEQERELSLMVQDLLQLEAVQQQLAVEVSLMSFFKGSSPFQNVMNE